MSNQDPMDGGNDLAQLINIEKDVIRFRNSVTVFREIANRIEKASLGFLRLETITNRFGKYLSSFAAKISGKPSASSDSKVLVDKFSELIRLVRSLAKRVESVVGSATPGSNGSSPGKGQGTGGQPAGSGGHGATDTYSIRKFEGMTNDQTYDVKNDPLPKRPANPLLAAGASSKRKRKKRSGSKDEPEKNEDRREAIAWTVKQQLAEKRRIGQIRELTILANQLTTADAAVTGAIRNKVQALRQEQASYTGKGRVAHAVSNIQERFGDVRARAGAATQSMTQSKSSGASTGSALMVALPEFGAAISAIGPALAAVGSVAAPVAAGFAAVASATVGPIIGMVGLANSISSFVETVNPGLVQQLNMTMRDMTAVIGTALNPVLQGLVPMIRQFADTLLPAARAVVAPLQRMMAAVAPLVSVYSRLFGVLMDALMPVVELIANVFEMFAPVLTTIANTFGMLVQALRPAMEILTSILQPILQLSAAVSQVTGALMQIVVAAIMPVISVVQMLLNMFLDLVMVGLQPLLDVATGLSQIVAAVADAYRVLMSGFMALAGSLGSMFGGMKDWAKDGIQGLVSGFKQFVNYMILTAAKIAKFFGANSFVQGMIDSMKPKKEDSTGLAAAQNPQYKSIEALGKDLALQAAVATGGGEAKKDPQEDMLKELQKISQSDMTLADLLAALPGKIAEALKNGAWNAAKSVVLAPLNLAAGAIRGGVKAVFGGR